MRKLIKFEKADCNPCVMVSDLLDKSGVEYEKVNPFNNPELAMKYKVRTVPTTILLDQDEEIKRINSNDIIMYKNYLEKCIYL